MNPKERIKLIDSIALHLQENYSTNQIIHLLSGYGITINSIQGPVNSKRIYASDILSRESNELIIQIGTDLGLDVLDMVVFDKFRSFSKPQQTNSSNLNQQPAQDTARKVFISHSSQDKDIVEKIIDLLRVMGINPDRIFCSSFEGYGIDLGENFLDALKRELSKDVLVIFVLSKHFYTSPICLCEMGAAWVTTKEHIPILIPPFGFKDVQGVFPLTQGMTINDKAKLNSLKEKMEHFFNLNPIKHSIWERDRDNILTNIKHQLSVRN